MSDKKIEEWEFMKAVWNAILRLFGEYGASKTSLQIIEYFPQKKLAIVKCSHKTLEIVKASVASMTEIRGKLVAVYTLGVSGTLRALRRKYEEKKLFLN